MATIVSGMRPTGRLHLGHLEGVLRNWLKLQQTERCFFFVADIHALTDRNAPEDISQWSIEMARDWLALGIDPEKCVIFVQSHVPEHVFLSSLLGMVTPVGALERSPTYKDRTSELGESSENLGLLAYPVLMAADVALYGGERIPVGEDQVSHLELAREIIRKFNARFRGADLVEPQPLLTKTPKVMGTDGRKMSKSYGNTIELSASPEDIAKAIRSMKTDEARKLRTDPGDPDRCNLFPWQEIYTPDRLDEIRKGCTSAALGCVDDKTILRESIERELMVRHRKERALWSDEKISAVLKDGAAKAREAAQVTMKRVVTAVGLIDG